MVVQWKENLLEPLKSEDLCDRLKLLRKRMPKGFKSLRVEFQVGTVVTQAWAEVQHSIVYKNPNNISTTPAMRRLIDAINGLAITNDIMLKELKRSLEEAEKEAEDLKNHGEENFSNIEEQLEKLKTEYMSLMQQEGDQDWVRCWHKNNQILSECCQPGPVSRLTSSPAPTTRDYPRKYKVCIPGVLQLTCHDMLVNKHEIENKNLRLPFEINNISFCL